MSLSSASYGTFNEFSGIATVSQRIHPLYPGQVKFYGIYWPAQFANAVADRIAEPHERVEVIGREGLTLIVKPLPSLLLAG